MSTLFVALWIADNIGSGLGLLLNILLLFSIIKTTNAKTRPYSYLLMTSALCDVFFSIIEFLTQHQVLIDDGVLLVMPHGLESFLGDWSYIVCMTVHSAVFIQAIAILPALFHYRYRLVSSSHPVNPMILLRNAIISFSMSILCGIILGYGVYQASLRGHAHYLRYATPEWMDKDDSSVFRYAIDIRDWGTITFFFSSLGITLGSAFLAGYYILKAWKAVNRQYSSERTKELQRQFTRGLIAQTISAAIFTIFPMGLVCIAMLFKLNGMMIGSAVMSPFSWLPSANALLTIGFIKAYRHYVMTLMGCHPSDTGGDGSIRHAGKSPELNQGTTV